MSSNIFCHIAFWDVKTDWQCYWALAHGLFISQEQCVHSYVQECVWAALERLADITQMTNMSSYFLLFPVLALSQNGHLPHWQTRSQSDQFGGVTGDFCFSHSFCLWEHLLGSCGLGKGNCKLCLLCFNHLLQWGPVFLCVYMMVLGGVEAPPFTFTGLAPAEFFTIKGQNFTTNFISHGQTQSSAFSVIPVLASLHLHLQPHKAVFLLPVLTPSSCACAVADEYIPFKKSDVKLLSDTMSTQTPKPICGVWGSTITRTFSVSNQQKFYFSVFASNVLQH